MSGKRRWLALVAATALVVSACGRGDDEETAGGDGGSEAPAPPEGPVEGTIEVWAMGTEGEKLDTLAEGFMAEHPDVTVEVTPVPWDAAHDRLVNAIAGGEVPDVTMVGTTWMGELAALDGLDPTPSSIEPTDFFAGAWDTTVVDGTSYGVPWYVETRLVYYRTDLAEAGGFSGEPATWDDLTALAEATVEAGATHGINLQPGGVGSWQTFLPFFWQAGGELTDAEGAFTLGSDACEQALGFYDSFFESGLTRATTTDVPLETEFAEGAVGSFISGPWMVGVVTDAGADPGTWTVAHQPTETAGTSFVGGSNLAVLDQADNKAAAWAFVEYLSRPEVQVTWYGTVSDLPSVQAAWDDPSLADDEVLAAFGDQLDDAEAPPAIATWEQVANAIDTQIEQVTVGDTSPADGCAAMQAEAEAIGTGS